jgi:hypothetical protein
MSGPQGKRPLSVTLVPAAYSGSGAILVLASAVQFVKMAGRTEPAPAGALPASTRAFQLAIAYGLGGIVSLVSALNIFRRKKLHAKRFQVETAIALAALVAVGLFSRYLIVTIPALVSADQIQATEVYDDRYQGRLEANVSGQDSFRRFVSAMHATESWSPHHPSFTKEFYVVVSLRGGERLEYLFGLMHEDVVYISFVRKRGNDLRFFGHARSRTLYEWLQQNRLL